MSRAGLVGAGAGAATAAAPATLTAPAALVAAAEQYGLPIHAIGVGEKMEDLRPFDPDLVARVIAGVA